MHRSWRTFTSARRLGVIVASVALVVTQAVAVTAPAHAAVPLGCTEEQTPVTCLDTGGVTGLLPGVTVGAAVPVAQWVHTTTQTTAQLAIVNASEETVNADFSSLQYSVDGGTSFVSADNDLSNVTVSAGGEFDYTVTLPADVVTVPTTITVGGAVSAADATPIAIDFGASPEEVLPGATVHLRAQVEPTSVPGSVTFTLDGSEVATVAMGVNGTATTDFVVPSDAAAGASVLDGTFTPTDPSASVKVTTSPSGFVVDVPTTAGATTLDTTEVTGLPAGVSISFASSPSTWTTDGSTTTVDLHIVNVSGADREFDLSALRFAVDDSATKVAADGDVTDVAIPMGSDAPLPVTMAGDLTSGKTIVVTGAAQQLGQMSFGANADSAVAPGTQMRFVADVVPLDVAGTMTFTVNGTNVGSPVTLVKGHATITWTVPNSYHGTYVLSGHLNGGAGIAFTTAPDSFVVAVPPTCNPSALCIDASSVAGAPDGLTFTSTTQPASWSFDGAQTNASIEVHNSSAYNRHFDLSNITLSPDGGVTAANFTEDSSDVVVPAGQHSDFTVAWSGDQRTATKLTISGDVSQFVNATVKLTPTVVLAPATASGHMNPQTVSMQATVYPPDVAGSVTFTLDDQALDVPVQQSATPGTYSKVWTVPSTLSRAPHPVAADFIPSDVLHAQEVLSNSVTLIVKASSVVINAPTKLKAVSVKGVVTVTFKAAKQVAGAKITDYKIELLAPKAKKWVTYKHVKSAKPISKLKGLKKGAAYKVRVSTVTTKGTSKPSAALLFKVK